MSTGDPFCRVHGFMPCRCAETAMMTDDFYIADGSGTVENIKENGVRPPSGATRFPWHWRCGQCGLIRQYAHQSQAEREARAHNRKCKAVFKQIDALAATIAKAIVRRPNK